jgi:hypothetical protein
MRKNSLKEKLVDAARWLADSLPIAARFASYGPIVYAGLGDVAQGIADRLAGLSLIGGAVGAVLVAVGVLIRFLPGTSADLRQTATRMIEGGIIVLILIGAGPVILQNAFGLGKSISNAFSSGDVQQSVEPTNYFNPWSWGSSDSNTGR